MSVELNLESDSIDVLLDAILFTLQNAPSKSRGGAIAINEADYTELNRIKDLLEESYLSK